MKVIINKDILVNALNTIDKVVVSKASLPILTGYFIEATKEVIIFKGTNGDESIIFEVEVDGLQVTVEEPGKIVVPSNFLSIAKKLDEDIEMSIQDLLMHIKSGKSIFKLNCMDGAEYPAIKYQTDNPLLSMTVDEFKDIVRKTAYAASTTEMRPILQSVHVKLNGKASFSATDSHRLAYVKKDGEFSEDISANIPAKALIVLSRIINDGDIEIFIAHNQITFKNDKTTFITRVLEGNYPETDRLIPNSYLTTIKVNTESLIKSLELLKVIDVKADLEIKQDVLKLSNQQETGAVKDEVVVDQFNGEELVLTCNVDYLLDALKNIDSEDCILNFQGDSKPFTLVSPNHDNELHLLLPIRRY